MVISGAESVLADEESLLGQFGKRVHRPERPLLSGVEDWIAVGVERELRDHGGSQSPLTQGGRSGDRLQSRGRGEERCLKREVSSAPEHSSFGPPRLVHGTRGFEAFTNLSMGRVSECRRGVFNAAYPPCMSMYAEASLASTIGEGGRQRHCCLRPAV